MQEGSQISQSELHTVEGDESESCEVRLLRECTGSAVTANGKPQYRGPTPELGESAKPNVEMRQQKLVPDPSGRPSGLLPCVAPSSFSSAQSNLLNSPCQLLLLLLRSYTLLILRLRVSHFYFLLDISQSYPLFTFSSLFTTYSVLVSKIEFLPSQQTSSPSLRPPCHKYFRGLTRAIYSYTQIKG
jgi:hypothetical protein